MPTFDYANTRDFVAAPLIQRFGLPAYLRKQQREYDPGAGEITATASDYPIFLVRLPVGKDGSKYPEFSAELIALFDEIYIISSRELSSESIVINEADQIIIGESIKTIKGVSSIQPGGVSVAYKVGVVSEGLLADEITEELTINWDDSLDWDDSLIWRDAI